MTPTVSQVKQWKPETLVDQADEWTAAAEALNEHATTADYKQDESLDFWNGTSGFAARVHMTGIVQNGRSVAEVITEAADAVRTGAESIRHCRSQLVWAVADAEQGRFIVNDDGSVAVDSAALTLPLLHANLTDRRPAYMQAAAAFENLASQYTTRIQSLLNQLDEHDRSLANAVGDVFERLAIVPGVNRAVLDGPLTGLNGEDGQSDGVLIRDGNATDGDLDRIGDILSSDMLTPDALDALARGEKIDSLPQGTYDYLNNLYNTAGRDGILDLADDLRDREAAGDPNAASRLDGLANGLLVLSNENIGTGESTGGYERVPPAIRDLVTWSHDYVPGGSNYYESRTNYLDMQRFGEFISESNPGYQAGTEFSLDLHQAAANYVDLLDSGQIDGLVGDDKRDPFSTTASQLFDIGVRNEDASYALLTGTSPGGGELGFHRDSVLMPLMTHEWPDDGANVGRLVDWIPGDSIITDSDDPGQVERATRAGEAAYSLVELMSTTESGYQHPRNIDLSNNFSRFIDIPGPDGNGTQSIGEVNPKLTQSLSGALSPHILDMVDAPNYAKRGMDTAGFGDAGPLEAARVATILNTDEDAGVIFNGSAVAQAQHLGNMFADIQSSGESAVNLGTTQGRLLSLAETGITGATLELNIDGADLADEQMRRRSASLGVGYAAAAGGASYIPYIGNAAAGGINSMGVVALSDLAAEGNGFSPEMPNLHIPGVSDGGAMHLATDSTNNYQMHSTLSHLIDQGKVDLTQIPERYIIDGRLVDYQTAANIDANLQESGSLADIYHWQLSGNGISEGDWATYRQNFADGGARLETVLTPMQPPNGIMPTFSEVLMGEAPTNRLNRWIS